MGEIIILEQFYRSLSPELRVWVKQRDPETVQEAAQLVETFLAAQRGSKSYRSEGPQKSSPAWGKLMGSGGGGREPGPARQLEQPVIPMMSKSCDMQTKRSQTG